MIRHIKKFNNTADFRAAYDSGEIASPFIAFDASSNTIFTVIPEDSVPGTVDYSEYTDSSAWASVTYNTVDDNGTTWYHYKFAISYSVNTSVWPCFEYICLPAAFVPDASYTGLDWSGAYTLTQDSGTIYYMVETSTPLSSQPYKVAARYLGGYTGSSPNITEIDPGPIMELGTFNSAEYVPDSSGDIPDSSGEVAGWGIDPSTAWYEDVNFSEDGTEYFASSPSDFNDVLDEIDADTFAGQIADIYDNDYDYAIALVTNPDSYVDGVLTGGTRYPGVITSDSAVTFPNTFFNDWYDIYLVFAYSDGTDTHYTIAGHASIGENTGYGVNISVETENNVTSLVLGYDTRIEPITTWGNTSYDPSANEPDVTFSASPVGYDSDAYNSTPDGQESTFGELFPYLQVAAYLDSEKSAAEDVSTYIEADFNASKITGTYELAPQTDEGAADCSTSYIVDASTDLFTNKLRWIYRYADIVEGNVENATRWSSLTDLFGNGLNYANENWYSDTLYSNFYTSQMYIDLSNFRYFKVGVQYSDDRDASVNNGYTEDEYFYSVLADSSAYTLITDTEFENNGQDPIGIQCEYKSGEIIGALYDASTDTYGPVAHMIGFDYPHFPVSIAWDDNNQEVQISSTLDASCVACMTDAGYDKYCFGLYEGNEWEEQKGDFDDDFNSFLASKIMDTFDLTAGTEATAFGDLGSGSWWTFVVAYNSTDDVYDWDHYTGKWTEVE